MRPKTAELLRNFLIAGVAVSAVAAPVAGFCIDGATGAVRGELSLAALMTLGNMAAQAWRERANNRLPSAIIYPLPLRPAQRREDGQGECQVITFTRGAELRDPRRRTGRKKLHL